MVMSSHISVRSSEPYIPQIPDNMPLQNRVNPFGTIVFSPQRGLFTGNRGVLHNDRKQLVRPFRCKAWITCQLDYKGVKRELMAPNRWTELFFFDEATAFAAGHRPCAFCRNPAFKRFKQGWLIANAERFSLADDKITTIDAIIHHERLDAEGHKKTYMAPLPDLPDGVLVRLPHEPATAWLWSGQQLWQWTETGYTPGNIVGGAMLVEVLTPESFVRVFQRGYQPGIRWS
jgi:hypothetical protein